MISCGRILIVDPDVAESFRVAVALKTARYLCVPAWDSHQAIRELRTGYHDLMIAEIDMPGNENLELVRMAQQLAPEFPVILYTRNPTISTAARAVQLRAMSYLIKPVKRAVLIDQVERGFNDSSNFHGRLPEKLRPNGEEEESIRIRRLTRVLEETVDVIKSTRKTFKSGELAALQKKCKRLLTYGRWD